MATHSSIPAWKVPWTDEPGWVRSMGSHTVRHEWSDWAHASIYPPNTPSSLCIYLGVYHACIHSYLSAIRIHTSYLKQIHSQNDCLCLQQVSVPGKISTKPGECFCNIPTQMTGNTKTPGAIWGFPRAPQNSTAFAIWTDRKRRESTFQSGEMHPFEDSGQRKIRQVFFWLYVLHCVSVLSNSLQPHGLQNARLFCPWGFSRQESWSGLPCPPPGDLPGDVHCRVSAGNKALLCRAGSSSCPPYTEAALGKVAAELIYEEAVNGVPRPH